MKVSVQVGDGLCFRKEAPEAMRKGPGVLSVLWPLEQQHLQLRAKSETFEDSMKKPGTDRNAAVEKPRNDWTYKTEFIFCVHAAEQKV